MFMFHVALSLTLIALTAGCALYVFCGSRCEVRGACFSKFLAFLIILISLVSSACIIYCAVSCWQMGEDKCPMMMHGMKMQDKGMMGGDKAMSDKMDVKKGQR